MSATQLRTIAKAREQIERSIIERNEAMRAARQSGETWADIAAAAGMTPNGVRKALGFRREPQD